MRAEREHGEPMTTIIFANAAMFDVVSGERREGQHVVVEDDRIKEIAERPVSQTDARVINLAGRTLMRA
jgi:imidazolonepropionase-like amidohydrolase